MSHTLLSVGVDLGTTTTQMIVSRLHVENTAGSFSVPRLEITDREILYRSEIHFTPLLSEDTIDADGIREIIAGEYRKANITPDMIETGAVIITGETARKENAAQVLAALSDFAGKFVVATAGPALESVLAARGAGADKLAKRQGRYVLHFDIGGGTSNLALFDPDGNLLDTGCINVGGRLMKFRQDGTTCYVSPVLRGFDTAEPEKVVDMLVQVLEEAAGLRPRSSLLQHFITDKIVDLPNARPLFTFSGGVADLIRQEETDRYRYGDLGVLLGRAIRQSRLCAASYALGEETIRATVVGAGNHATELSGSTVYCANLALPIRDQPVIAVDDLSPDQIRQAISMYGDQLPALFLKGPKEPTFQGITSLAEIVAASVSPLKQPLVVVMEQDMAKVLGHSLQLLLGKDAAIACLDGLYIPPGSYLDLAEPVGGTAFPVVIKTLAF